jgi:hypothetical protein
MFDISCAEPASGIKRAANRTVIIVFLNIFLLSTAGL